MTEDTRPTGRPIDRRTLLRAGLTTGAATLAGCLGDDETSEETPVQTETPADTPAEADTPSEPTYEIPVTGEAVPELRPLDEATVGYMTDLDYGAGSLALCCEGEIELTRGYGWASSERTEPVDPEAMFRIGSISKLFTADAVLRLVEAGELALDDEFYPLLAVDPPGGEPADERLYEVTVEQLLNHAGGWNRLEHANPLFNPLVVVEELDLESVPERDDFVRYVLDRPLQFDPGTDSAYSNIGYVMLSLVVEGVTDDSFESVVSENLFEPADATDIHLGATRPENRQPDEIWYDDSEQCQNVFAQDESVACADYGIVLSAFSGAGGFVARAPDLARALDELQWFWLDGERYDSLDRIFEETDLQTAPWFGSLYDSFGYAGRRPDGWIVALFNDRSRRPNERKQIRGLLDDALAQSDG